MTRLGRLSCLLVALALGASLAATWGDRSALYVFLVTLAACALAVGLAIWIDDRKWGRITRATEYQADYRNRQKEQAA